MTPPPAAPEPRAEDLFADYLDQLEGGEAADFGALCARHPAHAEVLRRMHVRWAAMTQAFTALSQAGSHARVDAVSASVEALLGRLRSSPGRASRYAIGQEIARGAMGRVVSAWDEELRREVALKIHRDRDGDTRQQRRFLEEAQITGQLDHPGIVPIHELGLDAEGRPFFAMRLVRGSELGAVLAHAQTGAHGWTRTRVLHVLLRVCEAMAYAHSKGVVHRDLKPGNVMVGQFGETYVMDWGLARVIGAPSADAGAVASLRGNIVAEDDTSPLLTQHGDVVGTPAYMAPEIALGAAPAVAPSADVYSLGAILHHLCVGHMPYARPGETATAADILARVRAGAPTPLADDIPAELRAIHDRAMARDPTARYASMVELAEDLRAYLEVRVVRAYAAGRFAELRKWVARNKALSFASAAALFALLAGLAVSTRLWRQSERTAARLDTELRRSEFTNARLSLDLDDANAAEDMLWRQHIAGHTPRATAWALREVQARSHCLLTVPIPTKGDNSIALLKTSGDLFVGGDDGLVRRLAGASLTLLGTLGTAGPAIGSLAIAEAERTLLVGTAEGRVRAFDLATGELRSDTAAHRQVVRAIAVSTDGTFASAGEDGRVLLWHGVGAEPSELLQQPSPIWSLAFDRTSHKLACGAADGVLRLCSLPERRIEELQCGNRIVMALSFAPDVDELWVGSANHQIFVVQTSPAKVLRRIPTRNGTCRDLLHQPDGSVLAGGWWRVDHYAKGANRGQPVSLQGVWKIAVDEARERLFIANRLQSLSIIDRAPPGVIRMPGNNPGLASRSDLVALNHASHIVVRPVHGPTESAVRIDAQGSHLAISADGARLAVRGEDDEVRVFEVRERRQLFTMRGPIAPPFDGSMTFSPDGRELAVVAGLDRVVRVDATTGAPLGEPMATQHQVVRLCYAADSSKLAIASRGTDLVRVVDLQAGTAREFDACQRPASVAFSADGRWLALGGWQGRVVVYPLDGGERVDLRPHTGVVFSLAFAPHDPRLLISSCGANGITFWDLDTGMACYSLLRENAPVTNVQLSSDGRTLLARDTEGVVAIDLEHYERHVAGNLAFQLARRRDAVQPPPARIAELESWAATVLARPWPRWGRR